MPLVKIEARKLWSSTEKIVIIEAVHTALRDALKIPTDDRNVRFQSYAQEDFEVPPGKSENYLLLEVTLFAGWSLQAKRELYQGIVNNLGNLALPLRTSSSFYMKSPWIIGASAVVSRRPRSIWGLRSKSEIRRRDQLKCSCLRQLIGETYRDGKE